ncbi:MAG: hypothetical protein ABSF28_10730 [Terracidiphilus sp.]
MTVRSLYRLLLLMVSITAVCCYSQETATKTITIRMMDAKTGSLIPTSGFLIRIDHQEEQHGNWVKQNEDGSGKLTLPANALIVAVDGKYNSDTMLYVNCDSVRDKPEPVVHWYTLSDILATGVAAPNECSKHTAVAKPGEFVFYVRQRNWREQYKDFQ